MSLLDCDSFQPLKLCQPLLVTGKQIFKGQATAKNHQILKNCVWIFQSCGRWHSASSFLHDDDNDDDNDDNSETR